MAEELVGVAETARRLGLTSERIRQLARAGQLPPPAGRLGRQDVWRWRDVAVWAAATGRLGSEHAEGRQTVRAWLPGTARRRKVVDAVEPYGPGRRGLLHVRVWEPLDPAEPAVVVLGNLEDDPLGSVTNRFDDAAMAVGAKHLGPRALQAQFYDHWSAGLDPVPTFHQVVFTVAPALRPAWRHPAGGTSEAARVLGGSLTKPDWRETDRAEIEALTGEPLDVWAAGTYTSDLVRAAADTGGDRLGVLWDPERARDAELAIDVLPDDTTAREQRDAALASLAAHALAGYAAAAERVAAQPADSPVWLAAPEPADPGRLARLAASSALDDCDLLWQAVGWARGRLRGLDPGQRRQLVPAVGGGYARLHWADADVPEPHDPRDGAAGPMALPDDLLDRAAGRPAPGEADALLLAEHALKQALDGRCPAAAAADAPLARPAGPYSQAGPLAQRYLAQIDWHDQPTGDDQDAVQRLSATLGRPRSAKPGRDRAGNVVVLDPRRRVFAVEWPAGHCDDRPDVGLRGAVIRADTSRRQGAQPVFVDLPDGTIVPLPSRPGWRTSHDYLWGYGGEGPRNLAAAVADAVVTAAGRVDQPFRTAAETIAWDLAQAPAPPVWAVDLLVEQAEERT